MIISPFCMIFGISGVDKDVKFGIRKDIEHGMVETLHGMSLPLQTVTLHRYLQFFISWYDEDLDRAIVFIDFMNPL